MATQPHGDPTTRQTFGFGTGEESVFQRGVRMAQEAQKEGKIPSTLQRSSVDSDPNEISPQRRIFAVDSESSVTAESTSTSSSPSILSNRGSPTCSQEPSTSTLRPKNRPSGAEKRRKRRQKNGSLPSSESPPAGIQGSRSHHQSGSATKSTPETPECSSATFACPPSSKKPPSLTSHVDLNRQSSRPADHPKLLAPVENQWSVSSFGNPEGPVVRRRRGSDSGTARGGDETELMRGLPPAATVSALKKPSGSSASSLASTTHSTHSTRRPTERSTARVPVRPGRPKTRSQAREERGESPPPNRVPAHFVRWEDVGDIASQLEWSD
jgi:hypothetical protein